MLFSTFIFLVYNVEHRYNVEHSPNGSIFALIVGINTYSSERFPSLKGAVADALAFQEYLMKDLQVPGDQITLLCDEKATRSAILEGFTSLANSDGIKKGDPIFIFYAGHGAQGPSPTTWKPYGDQTIEFLVPRDYDPDSEPKIESIPDYTLAALLNRIAEKKGDNITVVFDCCHSASSLRGSNAIAAPVVRSIGSLDYTVSDDLDKDIWCSPGTRTSSVPPRLVHVGLRSYVFLSACSSSESAKEFNGQGCFSSALLKLLRDVGPHNIKYSEIIPRLEKIKGQNPQCEGVNRDRLIFDGYIPRFQENFFAVQKDSWNKLTLMAGSVHGFIEDDEFTIYRNKNAKENSLGVLYIKKLGVTTSTMAFRHGISTFTLPLSSASVYAIHTRSKTNEKALLLYIEPSNKALMSLVDSIISDNLQSIGIVSTPAGASQAHIALSTDRKKKRVLFEVVDKNVTGEGFKCRKEVSIPRQGDSEDLARILKGLSHYYWHLYRNPEPDSKFDGQCVSVAFYKLKKAEARLVPEDEQDNLNINNVVHVDVGDEEVLYGLKLINESSRDLFPVLFYFDNTDFSITLNSEHALAGGHSNPEPPLKKQGTMTIGYGSSAFPPSTFLLDDNQDMDVGFFRLILSTEPIDLHNIPQSSVFELPNNRHSYIVRSRWELGPSWTAINIKIVQHRRIPNHRTASTGGWMRCRLRI
ncbi:caspase domain-containing protein [Flammula alnicola]|nr:caspase domain-containing protein [Flammula alnicola]